MSTDVAHFRKAILFSRRHERQFGCKAMQSLPFQPLVTAHRALAMMLEGANLRAVSRLTGVPAVAAHFSENIDFAQLVTIREAQHERTRLVEAEMPDPCPREFLGRYAATMITPRVPK